MTAEQHLSAILAAFRALAAAEEQRVGPNTDMLATARRWSDANFKLMQALADAECDRIMTLPAAELRAEIVADGRDPDAEAAKARDIIAKALARHRPAH